MTLTALALAVALFPQPATPPGWELVWADEFNESPLRADFWRAEDAALVKNNELQYYTPFAATITDGTLRITSERRDQNGRQYTSALVETYGLFSMAFGRFEARMKLPTSKGLWPAFWMLPADGHWPPEIDIMEALGHQPRRVYMSNHWGVWPGTHSHKTTEFDGPDFSAGFHTFAVEWSPERLDFFVDGELRASHTEGIPQEPFYIIFNTAVGGHWPGNPDASSVFPQTTEIDWVRAYRKVEKGRSYLWTPAKGGEVIVSPRKWAFSPGESVRLNAVPEFGQRFLRWEGLPDALATQNPVDLTINANTTARAFFEPDPRGIRLISNGKPVLASSDEGAALAPQLAFDHSHATRWASLPRDNEWIQVDLGLQMKLDGVLVHFGPNHAGTYSILTSNDALEWTPVIDRRPGIPSRDQVPIDAVARYVRLQAHTRATTFGVSLADFRVYGRDLTR